MYALEKAQKSLEKLSGRKPETPRNPLFGDLGVGYFGQTNPVHAAKVSAAEKPPEFFLPGKATGPFVNYSFSPAFYRQVLEETLHAGYGSRSLRKGAPYLLEYSQPNPGKPMHLGHIRSTIIGDVCARVLHSSGTPVVRLNYLNDRGAHIAELITAMEEFKDLPKVRNEKDLLAYYVKIKAEIDSNPELKEKTRKVLENLKKHEKQLKKIREMSWTAFERNYNALDVKFDGIPLETELEEAALSRVQECLKKGVAKREPDNTVITQLEPELSNTVLLRSNGTPLYFTSDLALADWKWEHYAFGKSMIFTASEQNLHFRQLQLLLKKLGRPFAENYGHKGFGLIRLTEGKMSTRAGRVVLLEEVLSDVTQEAEKQLRERMKSPGEGWPLDAKETEMRMKKAAKVEDYSDEQVKQIAKGLGIGALKFGVLRISLNKDITFDPAQEVQFEGDTASYIQYAHVRCCGILEKYRTALAESAETQPNRKNKLRETLPATPKALDLNDSEKQLLKVMARFPETLNHVATQLEPHVLCDYALSLARAFTKFYDQSPVMAATSPFLRDQRILLVAAAKNVLGQCLDLLGIKALDKM